MRRSLELLVDIPKISLACWMPSEDQDAIVIPFQRNTTTGQLSIRVDPQKVEYDEVESTSGEWLQVPLACSQLVVSIVADCDDDLAEKEFLQLVQALTAEYVEHMLSYIRAETGQYWGTSLPMEWWELSYFLHKTRARWIEGDRSAEVLQGFAKFLAAIPNSAFQDRALPLEPDVWTKLGRFLQDPQATDMARDLLDFAKRSFDEHDYRTACIEAIVALEVGLSPFIRARIKERGVSLKRYDETRSKIGIADLLKVLFPLVIGEHELEDWGDAQANSSEDSSREAGPPPLAIGELIEQCLGLNRVRNKVVHQGKVPTEVDTIQHGIEAAEQILAFVRSTMEKRE